MSMLFTTYCVNFEKFVKHALYICLFLGIFSNAADFAEINIFQHNFLHFKHFFLRNGGKIKADKLALINKRLQIVAFCAFYHLSYAVNFKNAVKFSDNGSSELIINLIFKKKAYTFLNLGNIIAAYADSF